MTIYEQNQIKGQRAEAFVALRALDKGFILSRPLSPTCRYDYILDDKQGFKRVQVKYCDAKGKGGTEGAVYLTLEKRRKNTKRFYSEDEIDIVLAYLPSVDKILSFDKTFFHNKCGVQIRIKKSEKNDPNIVWFEDYVW